MQDLWGPRTPSIASLFLQTTVKVLASFQCDDQVHPPKIWILQLLAKNKGVYCMKGRWGLGNVVMVHNGRKRNQVSALCMS